MLPLAVNPRNQAHPTVGTVPKRSFSLVSTVLNDRAGCVKFFEQMARQTRPPDEIVIVDGGSRDGTWEFLQETPVPPPSWRLQVRQDRGCNVARGRNLAIEAAAHEFIASTDIGCEWEPEWLAELVAPFESDPACQAVMGSWSVREEDLTGEWARVEYALLRQPRMIATNRSEASSRSIAYTRTLWRKLGGYPEDLTLAGDDLAYAFLLHRSTPSDVVAAAPVPRCHWERPGSLRAFRKESWRNFRGAGEAGIFLGHTVKAGGRMAMEPVLLATGLVALLAGSVRWVAVAWLIAGAGLSVRVWRLRAAAVIAQRLKIPQPWGRLILFDYVIKLWGIIGFWEGWLLGGQQCVECRRRLREAGSQSSTGSTP